MSFSEEMSPRELDVLGLTDPRVRASWEQYCRVQADAIAADVRLPRAADYEEVRLTWARWAMSECDRLGTVAGIVHWLPSELSGFAPGSIYGLRAEAGFHSVSEVTDGPLRDRAGRGDMHAMQLEQQAMINARLWLKSPAYFVCASEIASFPVVEDFSSVRLPNRRCLVFHDAIGLDPAPGPGDTNHVVAWVFLADDEQRLLPCVRLLTGEPGAGRIRLLNGAVESPALRGLTSRLLGALGEGQWRRAPRKPLRGNSATLDRAWRRALAKGRERELATGSFDGVAVLNAVQPGE